MSDSQILILGLLLWNILYDPVLYLSLIGIAYSNDLTVLVEAEDNAELEHHEKQLL